MGRRSEHTFGGEGDHGGPTPGRTESGPQRGSQEGCGGPVHHTMVGPQHKTEGACRKQLAQSHTWFVAL